MKQSKFSLADLLTVLGTLGFGFFCFLSLNFLSLGETVPSIVWAASISFVIGGFALGAKLLKRTTGNFKTLRIWEWVFLFLFVVTAFAGVFPFSHYFFVYDHKSDIQQKVTSNLTQAEKMFTDYDNYATMRLNIYKSRLNSIVAGKNINPSEYRKYGFVDGTDDNTQVENKMFTLKAKLFPSNYVDMKQVDSTWLTDSKAKVANWSPIGIVKVINTVKIEITSWKDQLKQFSSFRAQGETAEDFEYFLAFNAETNLISKLGKPTVFSSLYAIGFYVLMLLSYFITRPSTKNHYRLFEKKSLDKNDIDIDY